MIFSIGPNLFSKRPTISLSRPSSSAPTIKESRCGLSRQVLFNILSLATLFNTESYMICSQTKQTNLFIDPSSHTRVTSFQKNASVMLQQLEENEELKIELFRITSRFQDLHNFAIESISRQKSLAESLFSELDATRELCRVKVMQAHSPKSIMEGISRMEILLQQLYDSFNSVEERCILEQKDAFAENELMAERKGERMIRKFVEQTRQASYDKSQNIAELHKLVDDLNEEVRVSREEKHCFNKEKLFE